MDQLIDMNQEMVLAGHIGWLVNWQIHKQTILIDKTKC